MSPRPTRSATPEDGHPPARPRADASMALLTQVMERPLDPGYAAAADRRRSAGTAPGHPSRSLLTLTVLALVGLLLTMAGLQARGQTVTGVAERDQLVVEITRQDAAAARLQRSNADLAAGIETERARQLTRQSQGALAEQVEQLGLVTGALAVAGPGVEVTIDDAKSVGAVPGADPRAATATADGRVLDQDLQVVVNGLWAAGAEAVSVNGQRLTALSAIRSAGQAILVDYRPLSPPYTIQALGDRAQLPARFGAGPGGRSLKFLADNFAVRYDIAAKARLLLPASAGLDVRHAVPPGPAPSGSAPARTPGSTQ